MKVTRRTALMGIVTSTSLVALAACSQPAASPTAAPAKPATSAAPAPTAKAASANTPAPTQAPVAQAATSNGASVSLHALYFSSSAPDHANFLKLFASFAKENPGITVEFDDTPTGIDQKILTMIAAGTPPDAMETHPAWIQEFYAANVLTDLTATMKGDKSLNFEDFLPAQIEFWTYQGKIYGVPYYSGPSLTFFNKTMFTKAGLKTPYDHWKDGTWTWDTLKDLATKLSTGSGTSKTWGWDNDSNGLQWYWCVPIWDNGGTMISSDGTKWGLDETPALDMLQMHADLFKSKAMPTPADKQSIPQGLVFQTGKLGMIWGGRFRVVDYMNLPFEVGEAPTPKGKVAWVNRDGPNGTAIPKGVKHFEDSYKLARYMGSPEVQKVYLATHRPFPVRTSVLESPDFKKSLLPWEDVNIYIQSAKSVRVFELPAKASEIQRVFDTEWDKVILGQEDAKQAMANAVPKMNALLGKK